MTKTQPTLPFAPPPRATSRSACSDRTPVSAADIAAEDWDLLFRAALELLARVATEKAMPDGAGLQLQAAGALLREILDALDHLRRSAPVSIVLRHGGAALPEGESQAETTAPPSR